MYIGIQSMNGPNGLGPARLARALEDRRYESLWVGEHSHIPTAISKVDYLGVDGLPEAYRMMLDPYVSLAAAAAATTRIRLATGVALPLERPILVTAKEVATLDVVSSGRVCLGVGVGWIREELTNLSTVSWSARYRALEECVSALRCLWTEDQTAFKGEFVNFGSVWSFPKPIQKPHPPILMGGVGKLAIKHAIHWADGWFPSDMEWSDPNREIAAFRQAAIDAGRDPDGISITIGTWSTDRSRLELYRKLGVERVVLLNKGVLFTPGTKETADDEMRFMDQYVSLVEEMA
jgi:probable F420-dependent oxidoreductase